MKTGTKVMFIIAIVSTAISIITFFTFSIVFLIAGSEPAKEGIYRGLEEGSVTTSFNGSTEEKVEQISLMFNILAGFFVYFTITSFINLVMAILGLATKNKVVYILNIVTSIFGFEMFNLLGGIFGLATPKEDPNKEPEI